jgi:hypothetical protein
MVASLPEAFSALFTGIVAGLAAYVASYSKMRGELRAATEDLEQTIRNQTATIRATELEKAKVEAVAAMAADQRKAIYALAFACQSLAHSMCWLSWDTANRGRIREELVCMYDAEVHRLLPEIFGQLAVLKLLDPDLHARAYEYASKLAALDVQFALAAIDGEKASRAGVERFKLLAAETRDLQVEIDALFGGELQLTRPMRSAAQG